MTKVQSADRSKSVGRKQGFIFRPLRVTATPAKLSELDLDRDEELIVIERRGAHLGFMVRQMAYHHCAQGELAGAPYLVSF